MMVLVDRRSPATRHPTHVQPSHGQSKPTEHTYNFIVTILSGRVSARECEAIMCDACGQPAVQTVFHRATVRHYCDDCYTRWALEWARERRER